MDKYILGVIRMVQGQGWIVRRRGKDAPWR